MSTQARLYMCSGCRTLVPNLRPTGDGPRCQTCADLVTYECGFCSHCQFYATTLQHIDGQQRVCLNCKTQFNYDVRPPGLKSPDRFLAGCATAVLVIVVGVSILGLFSTMRQPPDRSPAQPMMDRPPEPRTPIGPNYRDYPRRSGPAPRP
jgi:hypothetical protein